MQAKSLYISHAVSNFYGADIDIWAGFGPVGITKKIGPIKASKVIIHKSCGEQFLWNRNLDLGWIWDGWQY